MSKNTVGFWVGPGENSLAAAIPAELYLMRFLRCNIPGLLSEEELGEKLPAPSSDVTHTQQQQEPDSDITRTIWEINQPNMGQ